MDKCWGFVEFRRELGKRMQNQWKFAKILVENAEFFLSSGDFPSLMIDTPIVKSRHDSADDGEIIPPMPVIDPSELIGCTFLMDKEDGQ
jgi:hypothetical protein